MQAAAKTLPGPEPNGPEVLGLRAIHQHGDGVITFHRKNSAGEFENLFGIRAEHLDSMFAEVAARLDVDAYVSLNAYWHPERGKHYLAAAQARKRERLRYLTCAFVDVDCYRAGMDFGKALGSVVSLQDAGVVPPASVIVRSGRGLWMLWLLRDAKDPSIPQRAFADKVKLYADINRALGERLAHLGADAAARDALRLIRVPGSRHSGSGERVKYFLQCDASGRAFTYTLDELAELLGAERHRTDQATARSLRESHVQPGERLRGHAQLNARRLREFEVLRHYRGGFSDGCRNHAALLYAWLLSRSGMERGRVLSHVEVLAADCRPPLDLASCRAALKTAFGRTVRRMRDQTIADWLDVTPAESELLERLPAASRFAAPAPVPIIAPPDAEDRRDLIRRIVERHGAVPSCRTMKNLLKAHGHAVSHVQVASDYHKLGFTKEHAAELKEAFRSNNLRAELQSYPEGLTGEQVLSAVKSEQRIEREQGSGAQSSKEETSQAERKVLQSET